MSTLVCCAVAVVSLALLVSIVRDMIRDHKSFKRWLAESAESDRQYEQAKARRGLK